MIIEKNKNRWISRNKLTDLLNNQDLLKDILSIEIINSNELSNTKELSSYSQINKYTIVIISREYSFFLGLPLPFSNKNLSGPGDIISILTKDIVLGLSDSLPEKDITFFLLISFFMCSCCLYILIYSHVMVLIYSNLV